MLIEICNVCLQLLCLIVLVINKLLNIFHLIINEIFPSIFETQKAYGVNFLLVRHYSVFYYWSLTAVTSRSDISSHDVLNALNLTGETRISRYLQLVNGENYFYDISALEPHDD
uniref:Uncharacterized protein n=1 Tax=Glossina pallidipes TaxID=7398 RepID=A0A1A9ZI06_GLOPL